MAVCRGAKSSAIQSRSAALDSVPSNASPRTSRAAVALEAAASPCSRWIAAGSQPPVSRKARPAARLHSASAARAVSRASVESAETS